MEVNTHFNGMYRYYKVYTEKHKIIECFFLNLCCVWCSTCFCVVLCVGFCSGHLARYPLHIYILYFTYNILSLSISSICIILSKIPGIRRCCKSVYNTYNSITIHVLGDGSNTTFRLEALFISHQT